LQAAMRMAAKAPVVMCWMLALATPEALADAEAEPAAVAEPEDPDAPDAPDAGPDDVALAVAMALALV